MKIAKTHVQARSLRVLEATCMFERLDPTRGRMNLIPGGAAFRGYATKPTLMLLPCRFCTWCWQGRIAEVWFDQREVTVPSTKFLASARNLLHPVVNMIVWIKSSPSSNCLRRDGERYSWAPVSRVGGDGLIEVTLPNTTSGPLVETVHRDHVVVPGLDEFAMAALSNAKGVPDRTISLVVSPKFPLVCLAGKAQVAAHKMSCTTHNHAISTLTTLFLVPC